MTQPIQKLIIPDFDVQEAVFQLTLKTVINDKRIPEDVKNEVYYLRELYEKLRESRIDNNKPKE